MNKELKKINERISFYSFNQPHNLDNEEYNKLMAELFAEKREILSKIEKEPIPIDRLRR